MKYAKLYSSIFEGSLGQDWKLRSLFFDLLALCDWYGIINLDYGGIAAITWRDIDDVIYGIKQLAQPDPNSRTGDLDGRRVVCIDETRPHMGFKIVNFAKYRDRGRRVSPERREQQRKWIAEKRSKQRVSTSVDILSTSCRPEPPSNVDHLSTTCRPDVDHKKKIEDERKKNARASSEQTPQAPVKNSSFGPLFKEKKQGGVNDDGWTVGLREAAAIEFPVATLPGKFHDLPVDLQRQVICRLKLMKAQRQR